MVSMQKVFSSTRVICFLISGFCFVVFSAVFVVADFSFTYIFLYAFICASIIGLGIFSVLEKLVQQKIKNIYKIILHTKVDKREELLLQNVLPQKKLKEVEEDVQNWAIQEANELAFYKQLSQYKKEFLQNISHELRTPLFSIQAYSENLEQLLHNQKNKDKEIEFVAVILRNTKRLILLIQDIGTISRLESNEIVLEKEAFIIETVIADVLEELFFFAQEKKTNIDTSFLKNKTAVFADREKIKQVLLNIIQNAIQHNPSETTLFFVVEEINEKNILLEISDNGKGIAEEHVRRIFERFYRADENRSRSVGGSGLGLAICKHIMDMHQSFIHVRSKPGVGTSFSIGLEKADA